MVIVDDNFLTADSRRAVRRVAYSAGAAYIAVCFNTPIAVCVARDAGRRRRVGAKVIRADALRLETAKAHIVDWEAARDAGLFARVLAAAVRPAPSPPAQPPDRASLVESTLRRRIGRLIAGGQLPPAEAKRASTLKRAFIAQRRAQLGDTPLNELADAFESELLNPRR